MNEASRKLATIFAAGGQIQYLSRPNDPSNAVWQNASPGDELCQDSLSSTHHESGTLWMGNECREFRDGRVWKNLGNRQSLRRRAGVIADNGVAESYAFPGSARAPPRRSACSRSGIRCSTRRGLPVFVRWERGAVCEMENGGWRGILAFRGNDDRMAGQRRDWLVF